MSMTWLTEGYHTLFQCLGHNRLMFHLVLILSGVNIVQYFRIERIHRNSEHLAKDRQSTQAVRAMRLIFLLCAVSGYGWNFIKVWWPAWSVWCLLMVILIAACQYYIVKMRSGVVALYDSLRISNELKDLRHRIETRECEVSEIHSVHELVIKINEILEGKQK